MPAAWPHGFDAYREALVDAGAVDFDEQIYRAIEILLSDPDARSAAQARCRHLLVDEFQDLNPAHMLLIRLPERAGLQQLRRRRRRPGHLRLLGSDPEYLINFEDYFPGAQALRTRGQLPVPASSRDRGDARAVLQHGTGSRKTITTPAGSTDAIADFGDPLS